MACKRCPHHVRHGTFHRKTQNMVFQDRCGLLMRRISKNDPSKPKTRGRSSHQDAHLPPLPKGSSLECNQIPFPPDFDYFACPTYQETFKSGVHKNNAVPTKDFQYSERFSGNVLGDMEFL